jgi:hypothetical protein
MFVPNLVKALNPQYCLEAKEGRRKMQSATVPASTQLPKKSTEGFRTHPVEEVVYKAVTVGAILLVLGSLWVF